MGLSLLKKYAENFQRKRVFRTLKAGDIAIDCGANVGKVTERMARRGVRVIAFEPNPHAFKVLQKKFEGNAAVECRNQAVAAEAGTFKLFLHQQSGEDPVHWSTGSSLLGFKKNVNPDQFVEVEVVDLCKLLETLPGSVQILKIDIEGAEVDLLNKLIDKGIHKKVGKILVETHERIPELAQPTQKLRDRISNEKIDNIDLGWE